MSNHDDMMCNWYNFYPRLGDLCESWGINNKTLSLKTGISPATISKWKTSYEDMNGLFGIINAFGGSPSGIHTYSLSIAFCSIKVKVLQHKSKSSLRYADYRSGSHVRQGSSQVPAYAYAAFISESGTLAIYSI